MNVELLATKLYMPALPTKLVVREQLLAELDRNFSAQTRLLAMIAPAGFGKTTLLTSWLATDERPVAWLGLTEDDNDPLQFWAYVAAALQTRYRQLGHALLTTLRSAQPPPMRSLLTTLINELVTLAQPLILVLDDYHLVTNQAIHDDLAFLIEHLPEQVTLALTSRSDPPMPLSRWRARGLLVEVRAAELRFGRDELAAFLAQSSHVSLTPQQIAALDHRVEGWVAGLQLVALSLRGRSDVDTFLRSFTGSHRYIISYLLDEVLAYQPETIQNFLLQSSILSQLSAPLCQAVTQQDDAQAALDYLVENNLFTLPLDDEGIWYRYHHLFAEVLQHRLRQQQPDLLSLLHGRAGAWHAAHGQPTQAIHHYLQVPDYAAAATIIAQHYRTLLGRGEVTTLRKWLALLPAETIANSLYLSLAQTWVLVLASQVDGISSAIAQAERALHQAGIPASDARVVQSELDALHILVAASTKNYAHAITLGEAPLGDAALESGQQNNSDMIHALKLHALGVAYRMQGELEQAQERFQQSKVLALNNQDLLVALYAMTNETGILEVQGKLIQAQALQEEALRLLSQHGLAETPLASLVYLNLGKLQREFNQLEEAAALLQRAMLLAQQGGIEGIVVDSTITLALVAMGRSDFAAAHGHLDAAAAIVQQWQQSDTPLRLSAFRTRIWLAEKRYDRARAWLEQHQAEIDTYLGERHEIEQLTVVRVLLALGNPAALARIEGILARAQAGQRQGRVVEALALQALALAAQGDLAAAQRAIIQAITTVRGQVQIFVDEGEPMRSLLGQIANHPAPVGEQVRRLLAAFTTPDDLHLDSQTNAPALPPTNVVRSTSVTPVAQLIEPLSARELEVLALSVQGLTDQEIADRLIISRRTVKKHNENIYGKLAVANRTQAAARARELGLV
jgi:LuxR family transcriptional regulator, maltose regulon positive regulatory protein